MTDFTLVDPKGWKYDLHSVYSAYIGYFQTHNVPWYDRSWGHLFSSFEEFLSFSWPVVTVTDAWTGRAHIVTRLTSIGAFLKMIKTRFGETLPQAPNILEVTPFETSTRHLRHISDYPSYKKLHNTLPAAVLSAFKVRVRAGEPRAVKELWDRKDKTFLVIDFEWSERNEKSCLEWGYTAVRCGMLDAMNHWPPDPDKNYRKGHYIVADYVDKVVNKYCPNYPWDYAFGESQVVSKGKLPEVIQAIISSLASPDSETQANNLVLVGHGLGNDLSRLEEMKIKLPHNVLTLDTSALERSLFNAGYRGPMNGRAQGSTLSLGDLLKSFPVEIPREGLVLHNSGNDAFWCLWALQMMMEGVDKTAVPQVTKRRGRKKSLMGAGSLALNTTPMMGVPAFATTGYAVAGVPASPSYDLAGEFGALSVNARRRSRSPGVALVPGHGSSARNSRRLSGLPAGGR